MRPGRGETARHKEPSDRAGAPGEVHGPGAPALAVPAASAAAGRIAALAFEPEPNPDLGEEAVRMLRAALMECYNG